MWSYNHKENVGPESSAQILRPMMEIIVPIRELPSTGPLDPSPLQGHVVAVCDDLNFKFFIFKS